MLLPPVQLSKKIGVSLRTIYSWMSQGLLPYEKRLGGRRATVEAALETKLEMRRRVELHYEWFSERARMQVKRSSR